MLGIPFLDSAIWKWFKPQSFDDPVDRLNYFITSTLLTFFAIMVSAKQYVGSPIQCWMPMEFKGGWEQYAEDYCFIQNTFFVPFHEEIPGEIDERAKAEIGYYQWVPIILALQAIMFYLPNFVWKTLHQQSGIDFSTAVQDSRKIRASFGDARRAEVKKLVDYLKECLEFRSDRRTPARIFCFRLGSGLGSYVSMLYLMVKLFYLINIIAQFFILNKFLGSDYTFWGWETFTDLWNGREWMESGVFPRVTLCDFRVRRLANIHRYTVQCVLMINMFNEKIYLFIWFWFLFVAISTFVNFIYCFMQQVPAHFREKAAKAWLSCRNNDNNDNYRQEHIVRRFVHVGLRPDGVLLLRFIEGHAGAIVAREIATTLLTEYLEQIPESCGSFLTHPTKSVSPGLLEDGPHENLYAPEKIRGLMIPDYPMKN
ncbi:unnamed protein product [Auanema sp. JU1783]|nr:unnamed protein product [Auanema sp. JU1783]